MCLPNLDCSEADCLADFRLRKKIRLDYPGACSLEFQSLMQILVDKLFNWDAKNQKARGSGIFGTAVAFAPADEEQGRKTLHRHMQVWIKDVDQNLRRDLFHENFAERQAARKKLQVYVDKIMSASLGHNLVLHGLPGTTATLNLSTHPCKPSETDVMKISAGTCAVISSMMTQRVRLFLQMIL